MIFIVIFVSTFSIISEAYKVEENSEVHQYITNESGQVWSLFPYEIKQKLNTPLNQVLDSNYDVGDDIITGSGEEDALIRWLYHFWEPDNPGGGLYADGLGDHTSSYLRAERFFRTNVIPLYLRGDTDEAYYWLGRVAHLLEDASVPAHVHLDCHAAPQYFAGIPLCGDGDYLEDYTGANFTFYKGASYTGQQYYYESLPNLGSFNWNDVDAFTGLNKEQIELFRLFWFAAQRAQYHASNDVDGNDQYVRVTGGAPVTFSPSLWQGEPTPINLRTQLPDNINKISDAEVPHAMKAVAGLYRLFWEYAHTDWPTFHHNNQRTGFTILKGDMRTASRVNQLNLVLDSNVGQDHISRASVMDVDNDGRQDVVIASSKIGGGIHDGDLFDSELTWTWRGYQMRKKWYFNVTYEVEAPPSLGNIDSDKQREVVFGLDNGTLIAVDVSSGGDSASFKWSFTVPQRYSAAAQGYFHGDLAFTALDDVDNDGATEILFVEGEGTLPDFPGNLYVLRDSGSSATLEANYTLQTGGVTTGGGRGAPSIANIDSDDKPEIIVPSYYGVYVFDYDGTTLTPKWSNTDGKINGAIAIADVDKDNNYELIYTTHTDTCHASMTCFNKLYIRDALTGANEGGSPISLSAVSRVTPSIGDIDNDGNVEIIINLEDGSGKIACYEINGNACSGSWPYSAPTINQNTPSPDIVDVDGDGQYDIVFMRSNSKKIGILKGDGTLKYEFNVDGTIGSAPAIADVDDDGVAEIAVKRAGSPVTIFTTITDINQQPRFNVTGNIIMSGVAGTVIDINIHDNLTSIDPDNDNLNILYDPPYNTSGQWATTVNDTGDYVSYAEVNDGNLSSIIEIATKVFDNITEIATTFSDGASAKSLSYTGAENKTLQVILPKNATIVYSRIKIGGRT